MRNNSLLPVLFVLAGCASPVMVSEVSRPDGTAHRLICRAKLDCPQQAAQLCPGGYEIVDGEVGVIGTLSDVTVSCR